MKCATGSVLLAMFLSCTPVSAFADLFPTACQTPGQTVLVSRSGRTSFARGELYLLTREGTISVRERGVTTGRVRFTLPRNRLQPGQEYSVIHRSRRGAEIVVGDGQVCLAAQDVIPDNVVTTSTGHPEYVISVPVGELGQVISALENVGVRPLRTMTLNQLGRDLVFVSMPSGDSTDIVRQALNAAGLTATIDLHHQYDLSDSEGTEGGDSSQSSFPSCVAGISPVTVGILDGRINPRHRSLRGVDIEHRNFVDVAGSADHATAVAFLIAGSLPLGDEQLVEVNGTIDDLSIPNIRLLSANVFAPSGGTAVADLEDIAKGLDWLLEQNAQLINMSFSGARNRVFADLLLIASQQDVGLVAAVGNDGRNQVSFPGSLKQVLAVTAVDGQNRLYALANKGGDVAFAAPGVELFVPRRRGYAYASGTSYSSAVLTRVLANEYSAGVALKDEAIENLRRRAVDLGSPGRDSEFGYGKVFIEMCANP